MNTKKSDFSFEIVFYTNLEKYELLSPQQKQRIVSVKELYVCILHQVAYIENNKHKIPFPYNLRTATKIPGIFFHSIFELCVGVVGHRKNLKKNKVLLSDNYEWFKQIYLETVNDVFVKILNPYELTYEFKKTPAYGKKKQHVLDFYRREIREIKNFKNPYRNQYTFSYTSQLIECANELAQSSENWKEKFHTPFLKACSDYVKFLENPDSLLISQQDGKLTIQESGRKIGSKNNKSNK